MHLYGLRFFTTSLWMTPCNTRYHVVSHWKLPSSESGTHKSRKLGRPGYYISYSGPLKFVGLQDETYFILFSRRLNFLSNI